MEITLNSKEINKALISFVTGKLNLDPSQNIHVEYKAGRGENGPTASIIIDEVITDISKEETAIISLKESNAESLKVCNREDQSCFIENTESKNISETFNSIQHDDDDDEL